MMFYGAQSTQELKSRTNNFYTEKEEKYFGIIKKSILFALYDFAHQLNYKSRVVGFST